MRCIRVFCLQNQHGVAKAEETITAIKRIRISLQQNAATCVGVVGMCLGDKGTDKEKQAGTGQVKVGNERVRCAKTVARANEEANAALECGYALPRTRLRIIGINTLCASCPPLECAY